MLRKEPVAKKLSDAIATLSHEEGISLPEPNAEGLCAFSLQKNGAEYRFLMRAFDDEDMVSILCPLGQLRVPGAGDELYRTMLTANLLGFETNGLSVAYNPGDDSFSFGYSIFGTFMTAEVLGEVLGRFVVAASVWKERFGH